MKTTNLLIVLFSLFLLSCKESSKKNNITETISEDVTQLGKLLDFSKVKPQKVKFKYTYIDNSGGNKRMSVAGPSDYYLEALIYLDSLSMQKIRNLETASPNLKKETFLFDWLPTEVLEELKNTSPEYKGHSDLFFGIHGKAWCLDNKILIKTHRN